MRVFEVDTGALVARIPVGAVGLTARFIEGGRRILTAGYDGALKEWFADSEELLKVARELLARRGWSEGEREQYEALKAGVLLR